MQALAHYREFAPCEALRGHVRAFFSFTTPAENPSACRLITRDVRFGAGDPFCSPVFADGHVSIVFSFGSAYRTDGLWHSITAAPRADVIGPMSVVGPASGGERQDMVGAYFHAAQAPLVTHIPVSELTDRVLSLDDVWGSAGSDLVTRLGEANNEAARIDRLESALLQWRAKERSPRAALDLPGLAGFVIRRHGRLTVQCLANAAGVSRQHLTRVFRETVGVTPKLFCRLARFQAALWCAGRGKSVDWAQAAVEMGYSDQSHMIAEFRQFSSLTPTALALQRWFHPFIERARDSIFPIARSLR